MPTYKAKTIAGAERRVRELMKQVDQLQASLEHYKSERHWLAKLAATGPAFNDPLIIYEARKLRDRILRDELGLFPDGSYAKGGD